MKLFKKLALGLLLALSLGTTSGDAQITVPNTLQAGATIRASELNTNFTDIASKALNRITGGTIEGNVILSDNVTFDGVDISDYLLSTGEVRANGAGAVGAPAFSRASDTDTGLYFPALDQIALSLGGTQRLLLDANGLTVYGTNIINSAGKIPALTATYLASLDGSALTNINAASATNFTGSLVGDVEGTQGATSIAAGVIVNADINASAAIVDTKLATISTAGKVANSATTANTGAVADTIVLRDVTGAINASGLISTTISGDVYTVNTSIATPAFQLTTTPTAGYVLTSDASGNASWQASPTGTLGGSGTDQTIAMFDGDTVTLGNSPVTVGSTYIISSKSAYIGSFVSPSSVSVATALVVSGATPAVELYESDASLDNKFWRFISSAGNFELQKVDDAYAIGTDIVSFNGSLATFAVNIQTPAIKLTTGAGAGKVLTSDADGDATWETPATAAEVPTGAIMLFDASCPSGYTRFTALDNRFPRGNSVYGATGGSDSHTHSFSDTSTSSGSHSHTFSDTSTTNGDHTHTLSTTAVASGAGPNAVTSTTTSTDGDHTHDVSGSTSSVASHTHDVSGTTGSTGNIPAYINMIYCKKD